MKLYLTSERHAALLPAVCLSAVSVRRVPPSLSAPWRESAQIQALVSVSTVVPAAVLVPSASVAAEATGSVRVDLPVRGTEPGGKAEARTDATRIDEHHVASAAQLDQRGIRVQGITGLSVQGTNGFSAKHDMTAPKPNGGVRGIPPRGRPV
ncbi:hypothetical protein [Dactylosporangium sp. CA-092794]|uniref:hypothetical protein n=1 Tax=Dactylosporangium sp. CA-092794 TaxID=3239929 RepID=UPI003D931C8B